MKLLQVDIERLNSDVLESPLEQLIQVLQLVETVVVAGLVAGLIEVAHLATH